MTFAVTIRMGIAGVLLLPLFAPASDKPKDAGQMVDSGSFGVFLNGRRIRDRNFFHSAERLRKHATSQFKTEEGTDKSVQSSELQLTPSGEIRKYEFKELSPGQSPGHGRAQ